MKYLIKNTQQNSIKKINFWQPQMGINWKPPYTDDYTNKENLTQKKEKLLGTLKGKSHKKLNEHSISISRKIAGIIAQQYLEQTDVVKITKQTVREVQSISKLVAEALSAFSEEWQENPDILLAVVRTKIDEIINSREKNNSE
jgi:hypothetical protein